MPPRRREKAADPDAPVGSVAKAEGFEIEQVSWSGQVADGLAVQVHNRFGDLRARFGSYAGGSSIASQS